jgi:protein TonB
VAGTVTLAPLMAGRPAAFVEVRLVSVETPEREPEPLRPAPLPRRDPMPAPKLESFPPARAKAELPVGPPLAPTTVEKPAAPVEPPAAPAAVAPPAAPAVTLPRAELPGTDSSALPTGVNMTSDPTLTNSPLARHAAGAGPVTAALSPGGAPRAPANLRDALGSGRLSVMDRTVPRYPESARRAGAQGTTVLRVHVLETGLAGDIRVEESAGHPALDQAALDAVRRWRFETARENGRAVDLWVLIPFEFKLR